MTNKISDEKIRLLERVKNNLDLQPRFFSKIKKIEWFDILKKEGFLSPASNPKPVQKENEYWHVPFWAVTAYLLSSSKELKKTENKCYAQKYLDLIRNITEYARKEKYSNYSTWRKCMGILKNIPIDLIDPNQDIENIDYWLEDQYDNDVVVGELGHWLVELLNEDASKHDVLIKQLIKIVFKVTEKIDKDQPENKVAVLRVNNYMASSIVEDIAALSGERIGVPLIECFREILEKILDVNSNDHYSIFWRSAIEDHFQNLNTDDIENIMLVLFRDSLLNISELNNNGYLLSLLESRYITIQRTAIFVSGKLNLIKNEYFSKIFTKEYFTDNYRHEIYHFLKNNFHAMTMEQQDTVLSLISSITVLKGDGKHEPERLAYKKAKWYAAIKESEKGKLFYGECVDVIGSEPEHPDFSMYMSCGRVTEKSPVSLSNLQIMLETPEKLINFLNTYKVEFNFREANVEGLIKTFGQLINPSFEKIISSLSKLTELKPYYINELFSSFQLNFEEYPKRYHNRCWSEILDFSFTVFNEPRFWDFEKENLNGVFIATPSWVVSSFSRLIESVLKNSEPIFTSEHITKIREVLGIILDNQEGRDFDLESDAVSVSINSPLGVCFETYIKLMLFEDKQETSAKKTWCKYSSFFESKIDKSNVKCEFITLITLHYGNFESLSSKWTDKNSPKWTDKNFQMLFNSDNELHWQCAIQGYSYQSYLTENLYKEYKDNDYFTKIFKSKSLSNKVKNHYVEFIIIVYFHGFDTEKAKIENILNLIKAPYIKEVQHLVWFLWTQRKNKDVNIKKLVDLLWEKLFALKDDGSSEFTEFTLRLCSWVDFIDEINDKNRNGLKKISLSVQKKRMLDGFIQSLSRLSYEQPKEVFDVLQEMEWNNVNGYISNDDDYDILFKNLISWDNKGKLLIKDIAAKYAIKGDERLTDLYRKIVKDT